MVLDDASDAQPTFRTNILTVSRQLWRISSNRFGSPRCSFSPSATRAGASRISISNS